MSTLQYPKRFTLEDFVRESNKIEHIFRDPSKEEIEEAQRFIKLEKVTIAELEQFVKVYQPDARLRDKVGLNVEIRAGGKIVHRPPAGAPKIRKALQDILDSVYSDDFYTIHQRYEELHPFTDGNGRSGRILWLWCRGGEAPLGFMHHWYYDSLSGWRK